MTIKVSTPDLFEVVNNVPGKPETDLPTLSAELGIWQFDDGEQTGINFDVFGFRAPILSAAEARRLSKWLMQAAEAIDGSRAADARRGRKKRRYDEEDE